MSPNPRAPNERAAAWTGITVGFIAFVLYLATTSTQVASHDAAQFQTLARTGGIAHAGYPLLIQVLRLFGALPFGTLAFKANLLSCLSGAVAVGLAAYAGARLTRSPLAAAIAGLALALSLTLWQESVFAGVHAWTLALDAIVFLLALGFRQSPSAWRALAIGLLWGGAIASHLTSLSLAPVLLLVLARTGSAGRLRVSHLAASLAGLLIALSSLALIVANDRPDQPMNYIGDTVDPDLHPHAVPNPTLRQRIGRTVWLLSARQYLGQSNFDMLGSMPRRFMYLATGVAVNEFPFWSFAFVIVGGIALLIRREPTAGYLFAWLAGSLLFVGIGASFAMARIFFLPGLWALSQALAAGLAATGRGRRPLLAALGALVLAAPFVRLSMADPPAAIANRGPVPTMWAFWPRQWDPLKKDASWDRYGRGVMSALEPRAVVLACWEPATNLRYFRYGEPLRTDVDILYSCDSYPPRARRMVLAAEAQGRPTYSTFEPDTTVLLGHTFEPVWRGERGTLWRIH